MAFDFSSPDFYNPESFTKETERIFKYATDAGYALISALLSIYYSNA